MHVWAPDTHMGNLDGVLDFWIQFGPALALALIWEVNQQIEDLSPTASNRGKYIYKL